MDRFHGLASTWTYVDDSNDNADDVCKGVPCDGTMEEIYYYSAKDPTRPTATEPVRSQMDISKYAKDIQFLD